MLSKGSKQDIVAAPVHFPWRLCSVTAVLTGTLAGRYGAPLYWERDETTGAWACTEDYPPGPPAALPPAAMPPPGTAPAAAMGAPPSAEHASAHVAVAVDAATEGGPTESAAEAGADGAIEGGAGAEARGEEPYEQRIQRSLVLVEVDIPPVCLIDGVHSRCFAGAGTACKIT